MRRSVLEPVVLSDDERKTLERWAAPSQELAGPGLALSHRARVCPRGSQHRGGGTNRCRSDDRGQVAQAVLGRAPRRTP